MSEGIEQQRRRDFELNRGSERLVINRIDRARLLCIRQSAADGRSGILDYLRTRVRESFSLIGYIEYAVVLGA